MILEKQSSTTDTILKFTTESMALVGWGRAP